MLNQIRTRLDGLIERGEYVTGEAELARRLLLQR